MSNTLDDTVTENPDETGESHGQENSIDPGINIHSKSDHVLYSPDSDSETFKFNEESTACCGNRSTNGETMKLTKEYRSEVSEEQSEILSECEIGNSNDDLCGENQRDEKDCDNQYQIRDFSSDCGSENTGVRSENCDNKIDEKNVSNDNDISEQSNEVKVEEVEDTNVETETGVSIDATDDSSKDSSISTLSNRGDNHSSEENVDTGDAPDGPFRTIRGLLKCATGRSKLKEPDNEPYMPSNFTSFIDESTGSEVNNTRNNHSSDSNAESKRSDSYKEAVLTDTTHITSDKKTLYQRTQYPEVDKEPPWKHATKPSNETSVHIIPGSIPHRQPAHVEPVEPRVRASVDLDHYDFSHVERGYMVLIVNNRFVRQAPRDGADNDLRNMKEIARKFGFKLFNYGTERNLTKRDTIDLLKRAQRTDYSNCDCFAFMISTHGLEQRNARAGGRVDHALVCADDQLIFTSYITDMFSDENCPTLKNKPKFFFIQACRGENLDHGSNVLIEVPRGTDKTCSASTDNPANPRQSSVDEKDTRHEQDSWAHRQPNQWPSYGQHTSSGGAVFHQQQPTLTERPLSAVSQQTPASYGIHYTSHASAQLVGGEHAFGGQGHFHSQGFVVPKISSTSGHSQNYMHQPKVTPYAIVETPSLKCDNDMLVMFAIPPGMFAWRNTVDGSWMIHYLHQIVMAYDMRRPKNFLNLLTKVTARMSQRTTNAPSNHTLHGKKAVSVIEHKLTRDVFFQQKVPGSGSDWVRNTQLMSL